VKRVQGRRWRLLALVVAATVGAAACADDGPSVSGPGTAPATSDTAGPDEATDSTTPTAGSETGTTTPGAVDPSALPPALTNADGENEALSGIGRLDGFGSSCTAFLLDVGPPSGPAYAMTNGHCVDLFDSTTVLHDEPVEGATAQFRLFADTPTAVAEVPVAVVRYATMRGTDVAILELGVTRSGVIGLASYPLGSLPAEGTELRVVGVPVADVASEEWFLRGSTCTAGGVSRLVEFNWLWDDAVSSDCAGIRGGHSGSPVFAGPTSAPRVHAIVNTTSIGAASEAACFLGAPCEVTDSGTSMEPARSYAMPVDAWEACFTPTWDAEAPGCPVEQAPTTVEAPLRAVRPGATWGATIAGGSGGPYVAKAGPVATTDCREPTGYAATPTSFDDAVGAAEGVYVLCAASLDARQSPDTRQAGLAVKVVDGTPPSASIELSVTDLDGELRVEPIFAPPEQSSFDWKVGPEGSADCADPAGYTIYRRIPIHLMPDDLPATLCVIAEDEAGNRGEPQEFPLT
jgi:hypothetical protein